MNIYKELAKFKHIKYFDGPHKYYVDGKQELISGTTFVGLYKQKFDADKMSKLSAKKKGVTPESLIAEWDFKRDFASIKGTLVHNFAENFWGNKVFPYNEQMVIDKFGEDVIRERYEACVDMFQEFYTKASASLIPIAMELVIGDERLFNNDDSEEPRGGAGMVDGLFWNEKMGELQIWDYKTNSKIRYNSEYNKRMKAPINFLDDCEFEAYSIQLNLYQKIIEKKTNLKIGKKYLVWINEENETFQIIECKECQDVIDLMIKDYKANYGKR